MPSFSRKLNQRKTKVAFLVVCEGKQTEPLYFDGFNREYGGKLHLTLKSDEGDQLEIVREAIRQMKAPTAKRSVYDQVWCVFDCDGTDRDPAKRERFDKACAMARSKGIRVAYSNEAFEVWFILHFMYCDAAIDRSDYLAKVSENMDTPYRKNLPDMYERLRPFQDAAIRNSEKLAAKYEISNPGMDNPSTSVHKLVKEIIKASK